MRVQLQVQKNVWKRECGQMPVHENMSKRLFVCVRKGICMSKNLCLCGSIYVWEHVHVCSFVLV